MLRIEHHRNAEDLWCRYSGCTTSDPDGACPGGCVIEMALTDTPQRYGRYERLTVAQGEQLAYAPAAQLPVSQTGGRLLAPTDARAER